MATYCFVYYSEFVKCVVVVQESICFLLPLHTPPSTYRDTLHYNVALMLDNCTTIYRDGSIIQLSLILPSGSTVGHSYYPPEAHC